MRALLDHLLIATGKRIGMLAFHIHGSNHQAIGRGEDGHDDFGKRAAKSCEVARVGSDVARDYRFLLLDCRACEPFAHWERRMLGARSGRSRR